MAQVLKVPGLGSAGKILSAFSANDIPTAVIKGMGNAIIINRINALLGNPLGAVGLSFTVPGLGIQITPFTIANYFLLNGGKISLSVPALVGAIAAIFAGVNPTGTVAGVAYPQGMGSGSRLGGL